MKFSLVTLAESLVSRDRLIFSVFHHVQQGL